MKKSDIKSKRITLENYINDAINNGKTDDVKSILKSYNACDADSVDPADLTEAINQIHYCAVCG